MAHAARDLGRSRSFAAAAGWGETVAVGGDAWWRTPHRRRGRRRSERRGRRTRMAAGADPSAAGGPPTIVSAITRPQVGRHRAAGPHRRDHRARGQPGPPRARTLRGAVRELGHPSRRRPARALCSSTVAVISFGKKLRGHDGRRQRRGGGLHGRITAIEARFHATGVPENTRCSPTTSCRSCG